MVYCIECGTQLPDGAKFCMKCGTRLPDFSAPQKPAPKAAPQKPAPKAPTPAPTPKAAPPVAETVYIGKTGESLYVPGQGLYFIWKHERVYFLADFLTGARQLKELWRVKDKNDGIHTLGYHAGQLFFWFWSDSDERRGHFLYSLNISTLKVRSVFKAEDFRMSEVGYDSVFYQGAYYVHHTASTGEIIKLDLNSGKLTRNPMPDFASMPIPEDWIKKGAGQLMRPGLLKSRPTYQRFMALSGYGYRCFSYGGIPAVRFSLENPSDFTFMPLFTGTTADTSLLTQEKDTIYSYMLNCEGCPTHFYATRMSGNQVVENRVLLDGPSMEKHGLHTAGGWWRSGSKLYLYGDGDGGLLFDMEKKQFSRVKRRMAAWDFVEDGRGTTYVFWGNLYILLPDWMKIDQELLDECLRVELPDDD